MLLLKLALFVGPIIVLHATTTAQIMQIWGRRQFVTGALLALAMGVFAFWVSGWGAIEIPLTHLSAMTVIIQTSDAVFLALGFAIGLLIQVIRLRKPGPSLRAEDAFNQPLADSHAYHAAKRPSAPKF